MSVSNGYWNVISLGLSCQVSHQLRHQLNDEMLGGMRLQIDAQYFDYVVTPFATLMRWLGGGFPHVAGRGDIDVALEHPFWISEGIFFPHNFRRGGMVGPIDLDGTFDHSAAKIAHLRSKFLALDSADTQIIFVIGNAQFNIGYFGGSPARFRCTFGFSQARMAACRALLRARYGKRFRRLVVIENAETFSGTWSLPDVSRLNSESLHGTDGAEWEGNDLFWHNILTETLRRFDPEAIAGSYSASARGSSGC